MKRPADLHHVFRGYRAPDRKTKIEGHLLPTGMSLEWAKLIKHLSQRPPGLKVKIPKHKLDDPLKHGFRRSIGLHINHKHYRLTLPNGGCVHVEETKDHYIVHVDGTDPAVSPVRHLRCDAPGVWTAMCTGIGLTAGVLAGLGNEKQRTFSTIAGVLIGLAIGILTGKWGKK